MGECKAAPILRDELAFIGKYTASLGGQALGDDKWEGLEALNWRRKVKENSGELNLPWTREIFPTTTWRIKV